jgi:DNA-binding NarL/FixJ family response regulator
MPRLALATITAAPANYKDWMMRAHQGRGSTGGCWQPIIVIVTTSTTRVALADDDVLLREGLASLLERSGLEVVGQAGDASQLIALVRVYHPDLVVVDIRMPPTHSTEGLDAARLIREQFPETAVVVLSAHVEVAHAMDLLASGQRTGYLLKSRVTNVPDFIETLNQIVRGGTAIDPTLVQLLVARRRADDPLDALSPREREVLAGMAEGRSNIGIARRLRVTEATVEKHMHGILMKLHLPEDDDVHRRILAVLTFLRARLHAYSSAGGSRDVRSAFVKTRMIGRPPGLTSASCRARSRPLLRPSLMSARTT